MTKNSNYYNTSVELGTTFHQNNTKNWSGPALYWWFRKIQHPINNWYQVK